MGCAGSKPHHLLSSTIKDHHHTNSPQKGFILFNAKTIGYLKANEDEIRVKLIERCEQKMLKTLGRSTSRSLINSARRTLLPSSSVTTNLQDESKLNKNETLPSITRQSSDYKLKLSCVDAAVDFVLKYSINDFDIENFKSSNQLSLKQIRKDIMKKNGQNKVSSSKLNTSIAESNYKTLTLQASKGFSESFYKSALNLAIDEFGLFIQENFIVINEFEEEVKEKEVEETVEKIIEPEGNTEESVESEPSSQSSEEDALKLKEALELARQNFYKGKMSMVCLNKKGGYVVKEVTDQATKTPDETNLNDSVCSNDQTLNTAPRINIEYIENKENKSVSNASVRSLVITEPLNIDKLNDLMENDIVNIINDTIEMIVKYSTKSANENTSSIDTLLENSNLNLVEELSKISLDNDKMIDLLSSNFIKAKATVELLQQIEDFDRIDEKLLQSILNFEYVNREFKTYLSILENTLEQQLEKINLKISNLNESNVDKLVQFKDEKIVSYIEKNSQVRKCAEEIHIRVQNLPSKLFESKGLVLQARQTENVDEEPVDIKKEITFSILNVGEVLARTIDHYSIDENKDKEVTESKNENTLTTVEPSPVSYQNTETNLLHVNTEEQVNEVKENPQESLETTLSSPSFSSSSSISQKEEKQTVETTQVKEDIACLVESLNDMNPHLNCLEDYERNRETKPEENRKNKSSSSSSDVLSSNDESNVLVQQFISDIIDTESHDNVRKPEPIQKRMSLDEELLNQLDDVEKKVKYMNETCSENDDDDNEMDDENFDFDESVENENEERLFHPRRPSKIKSELRKNRALDLQEEIKQISNVIQDLVQTINVRSQVSDEIEIDETKNEDTQKSLNSKQSCSNIPVRQKMLIKQKAEDEVIDVLNTSNASVVFETSVDLSTLSESKNNSLNLSNVSTKTEKQRNRKNGKSNQKFKSKLPVKK